MSNLILNTVCNFDYGYKVSSNYRTDVSQSSGGNEQRRARWTLPLRKFTVPYGNKRMDSIKALQAFFDLHKGQYESFYFCNPAGRLVETIDAAHKTSNPVTELHLLNKPVVNASTNVITLGNGVEALSLFNIIVKVDGTLFATSNMTIDSLNGVIRVNSNRPASSSVITVEYDYLVRVRFATDVSELSESTYNVGNTSFDLQECR